MIGMTVCSGIGAPEVAAPWIDWRWQSEIERFPSAVLAQRFRHATNLGDMTRFQEWPDATVDVLCGGTPCQSFSVAGLRRGLADPRGNLMLTYLAIADRYRPEWLVWENVPGVLSSNGGRDFGAFLGGLGQLGYGFAYRVLDAQHVRTRGFSRAVPQRRRRVFVVGCLGGWQRAAAVLFDAESLRRNPPPRREAGEGTAASVIKGVAIGRHDGAGPQYGEHLTDGSCYTINCVDRHAVITSHDAAPCLTAREHKGALHEADLSAVVAFDLNQITSATNRSQPDLAVHHTLPAKSCPPHLASPCAVRRLTPRECERLMGFPDDWTRIPYRGKPAEECPDGPRYKALGNSWAVNCGQYVFDRLRMVHEMMRAA